MMINQVKRKLLAGEVSIGSFVMEFNTAGIASILEQAGSEFVVFDMEHSGFGTDTAKQLMSYCRGLSIVPFVRVPGSQEHFITRTLDAGAKGIMVPMVESKEQALAIVHACKYPPIGARGTIAGVAHDDYSGGDLAEKLRSANEETLIIAQIESEAGVENIEEILSVDGIDVAWVGHNDLSVSMGLPGQVNHPKVVAAMEKVAEVCGKYGKIAGRLAPDVATAVTWLNKGYHCIAYSNDIKLIQTACELGIREIKEQIGK